MLIKGTAFITDESLKTISLGLADVSKVTLDDFVQLEYKQGNVARIQVAALVSGLDIVSQKLGLSIDETVKKLKELGNE